MLKQSVFFLGQRVLGNVILTWGKLHWRFMGEIYSKWCWNELYGTRKTCEVIRVLTILFCRIETFFQTPSKPIDQVDEKALQDGNIRIVFLSQGKRNRAAMWLFRALQYARVFQQEQFYLEVDIKAKSRMEVSKWTGLFSGIIPGVISHTGAGYRKLKINMWVIYSHLLMICLATSFLRARLATPLVRPHSIPVTNYGARA